MRHSYRAVCTLTLAFWASTGGLQALSVAREWNEQLLSAIRQTTPNPPQHARNLFHMATAMYNAWAAYDATPVGYLQNEKVSAARSTRWQSINPTVRIPQ